MAKSTDTKPRAPAAPGLLNGRSYRLAVDVDRDVYERFRRLAEVHHRRMTEELRVAIDAHLEKPSTKTR